MLNALDEDLLSRNWRYDFELARLGPQAPEGVFVDRSWSVEGGRYLEYDDPRDGTRRRINFWRYYPHGSNVAIVYFDTSRHKPSEYYPAIHPNEKSNVGPLMILADKALPRAGLKYLEQRKFQLLHAGIDDVWGDFSDVRSGKIVAPTGPFVDDLADTLGNFMPCALEGKQP